MPRIRFYSLTHVCGNSFNIFPENRLTKFRPFKNGKGKSGPNFFASVIHSSSRESKVGILASSVNNTKVKLEFNIFAIVVATENKRHRSDLIDVKRYALC